MAYEITLELLASGKKHRKELLIMPFVSLDPILAHMTPRYGIQGSESVGEAGSNAQLRPYRFQKDATDTSDLGMRELTTYLGDVVEEFDPQKLWNTIFGATICEEPSQSEIAYKMAMLMAGSVGENLALSLFKAKRKADGTKTADLFDGFETIIEAEKRAGAISSAKNNLIDLGYINQANIVDKLMDAYLSGTHETLRDKSSKMFIPSDIYSLYNKGYRDDFGALPYNKEFRKTFLEGSDNKCELVPLSGMTGNRFIITQKSNMLVGMDQTGTKEKVEIRRPDNPKAIQFFMLAYFGVQFETLNSRRLCVGEYTTTAPTE